MIVPTSKLKNMVLKFVKRASNLELIIEWGPARKRTIVVYPDLLLAFKYLSAPTDTMLFWALAAALVADLPLLSKSGDVPIGLDPALSHQYLKATITCQDKGSIPISRVNDDYCDCPEFGEDEPGTSACANGTFYCKNIGSSPKKIESWKVNDGICDCCDGSDEYLGLKACTSTCDGEGKIQRQRLENWKETMRKGLHERQKLCISAEALKVKQSKLYVELQTQIEAKKFELENLRTQVESAESTLQAEKDAQKDAQKVPTEFKSGQEVVEDDLTEKKDNVKKEQEPESQSFPYPEQYAFTGDKSDSNSHSESFPYPEQYAPHNQQTDISTEDEEESHEEETQNKEPVAQESAEPESSTDKAAREARQAFKDAENQIASLEQEFDNLKKMLSIDFGPDGAFRTLQSECFTTIHEKYTYKLCPFKEAAQVESHSTSLGKFQGWANGYSEWLFDNGQKCWNGPERSVKVRLVCGLRNQVVSVNEPSTCVYEMEFESPAACSQDDADKLDSELREMIQIEHVRDEL